MEISEPLEVEQAEKREGPTGSVSLPLSRVKKIIKLDDDVRACSTSATFAVTVATEMFIEYLCEQGLQMSKSDKRKVLHYKDLASAVHRLDELEFLSGTG
ncbi:histone-fold-containing protein [Lipomyces arxii]|uniref:histone-fold-containing protein n=1 Tax=Lipomyces arxii TaxID=56418 RepID=UPI0034CED963